MTFDALILGAGPAGLAVANSFHKQGLNYIALDKGPLAAHVQKFPPYMDFFSSRELLEIDGFPLAIPETKPNRRQYVTYLNHFWSSRDLNVRTYTEVTNVSREADGFRVATKTIHGHEETLKARTVVVACGAYESPRMLDVPGEDLPHVSHYFTEPNDYYRRRVLVVGGRNSAIEAALLLYRSGARVALSYRRHDFNESGIKYWMRPDIENRLKQDQIANYLGTNVKRIDPDHVTLIRDDGSEVPVAADFVLLMTGYLPPYSFLERIGVRRDPETGIPYHDPATLETPTPGLFVAGVITGGNISGKVFIENCRHHGDLIAPRVQELLSMSTARAQ